MGTQTVLEQCQLTWQRRCDFTDFPLLWKKFRAVSRKAFYVAVKCDGQIGGYHTANSGAVLYVPDNVEIDQPIEGIFIRTAKAMFL